MNECVRTFVCLQQLDNNKSEQKCAQAEGNKVIEIQSSWYRLNVPETISEAAASLVVQWVLSLSQGSIALKHTFG